MIAEENVTVTKDELLRSIYEVLNEHENIPKFDNDVVRTRNLRYLNTEEHNFDYGDTPYETEIEKLKDNDPKNYVYRTFNFHQPAEGELMNHNENYDTKYRVKYANMKKFLDRITNRLKEQSFGLKKNVNDAVKSDVTPLSFDFDTRRSGKQTLPEDILDINTFLKRRQLPQRQNSRIIDFAKISKSNRGNSDTLNVSNGKGKNLGRFLWSMPNNDTKIAVQSMINAGIQASILSALEHFKELQEQQANFLHQHVTNDKLANLNILANSNEESNKVKFII